MKIEQRKITDLVPIKKNIRRHTDKQIAEYVRSVKMFGVIRPVVIDENNVVLAGNGLIEALKKMGKDTVDCYVAKGLSESEKKKLMLADNRVYELGVTDIGLFDEIIKDLGGDIDVPGWDEDLLKMMQENPVDASTEVTDYGRYEPEVIQPLKNRAEKEEAENNVPANEEVGSYAPVQPTTFEPHPVSQSDGKYVVCPNCGEKIWL